MKEIILNHPLVTHKLSILRNKNTGTKEFREIISEISTLLCYEATKDAVLDKTIIETPLEKYETESLNEDKYAFVPILRAGMSMVDGIIKVIPNAKIGHIGLYRNEKTLEPVEYYYKNTAENNEMSNLKKQTRYTCKFVYIYDENKIGNNINSFSISCPNCGAPLIGIGNYVCEYCSSQIKPINLKTWKMSSYKEDYK